MAWRPGWTSSPAGHGHRAAESPQDRKRNRQLRRTVLCCSGRCSPDLPHTTAASEFAAAGSAVGPQQTQFAGPVRAEQQGEPAESLDKFFQRTEAGDTNLQDAVLLVYGCNGGSGNGCMAFLRPIWQSARQRLLLHDLQHGLHDHQGERLSRALRSAAHNTSTSESGQPIRMWG